jgi:hypothetical protein
MKRGVLSTAAIFVLLLVCSLPATAQLETAAIVGTVRDTSGAVVPGTTVTLTNTATGIATQRISGADGAYEFLTVRDGVYVMTGEKQGFSLNIVDKVQVLVW